MSETQAFTLTLTQESDYVFRIEFDDTAIPALHTDESAPLGNDSGPNPSRMLVAAVANCLSASLLFSLRKYKNTPGTIVTRARATLERNEQKRLRVAHIDVVIELPDAAADYAQIERLLQQFENFCVVTESVRHGVAVDVSVRDRNGATLHASGGS
ncbi:OsmC family protein [Rhodanobacter fulvus Jip2]|jgi:organic hydroperoxide reductase OsmC/OhrA|uniref:OsmC family protein n=1 Tax=Rhodanobacter fulvus Jip2 TaxID=1163408 RepID=I4VT25_9GAMM|nr:OsmC family protein [Rhodanobacter fulvus]EIL90366.1 OsmC family protein [Rhodanobacter fulvus Jip2]